MLSNPIYDYVNQRVLISPLNWGLGHVARTISIIRQLRKQNCEVIICCDEVQERFYRNYFEDCWYVPHPGYPFRFSGKGNWVWDLTKNMAALNAFRKWEILEIRKLVKDFHPDLILSDQRFGFRSQDVKSIVVSHQLSFQVPFYAGVSNVLNQTQLKKFDEIWIPDLPGHVLSGALSKANLKNSHFIGWHSRFLFSAEPIKPADLPYLGIVSGPEPYANHLFKEMLSCFEKLDKESIIIAPSKMITSSLRQKGNCTVLVQPERLVFEELFHRAETVVSRAGYSTLMDLTVNDSRAILIPTPGQTEQLYLANYHSNHKKWKFSRNLLAELEKVEGNGL
jgi:hypothetical protein